MTYSIARWSPAAQFLLAAHRDRQPFGPIPAGDAPATLAEAYQAQDVFVAAKAAELHSAIAGYKIALTTQAMRSFTGFGDSIAGTLLAAQIVSTPACIRSGDYGRLIVESEIAFDLGTDVPHSPRPYDRETIRPFIASVRPAFELADDRHADYARLPSDILSLVVDNAWNEGAVLGGTVTDWQSIDLAAVHGVVTLNGQPAGEGFGSDVLGHPLDAMAWIANQLAQRGLQLRAGQVVITGSLVVSKFLQPGDVLRFEARGLGGVELAVRT